MKNILCLLLLIIAIITNISGQKENPYTEFGYKGTSLDVSHEDFDKITYANSDTLNYCTKIVIDFKFHLITFLDREDKVLQVKKISQDALLRWLTTDPAHQFYSPYLGMGNNPASSVDPDGREEYTNFKDKNGNLIKHVEDGSNAVFQITGETYDLHYEFTGWDALQGGANFINVTSVIQEQQNFNLSNTFIHQAKAGSSTYCNRATLNVIRAVQSGFDAMKYMPGSSIDLSTDNANGLYNQLANSSAYDPIDIEKAKELAGKGYLVVIAFKNPIAGRSGHLATFSVGDNIAKGEIANIGIISGTGFTSMQGQYNSVFTASDAAKCKFYTPILK